MKTFKCRDGNSRVFSKREVVFTATSLANFNLSNNAGMYADEEEVIAVTIAELTSKTKIIDGAWDAILTNGMDTPAYRVGDNFRDGGVEAIATIKAHIKTFFTDLD